MVRHMKFNINVIRSQESHINRVWNNLCNLKRSHDLLCGLYFLGKTGRPIKRAFSGPSNRI